MRTCLRGRSLRPAGFGWLLSTPCAAFLDLPVQLLDVCFCLANQLIAFFHARSHRHRNLHLNGMRLPTSYELHTVAQPDILAVIVSCSPAPVHIHRILTCLCVTSMVGEGIA